MKKNIFTKAFFILVILISLLIGIIFSCIEIANNTKLDSTFNGKYVASVKVDKNKEDDTPKELYAKEAADILEKRLNPMGINDISIEISGYDYLKVHGSKSNFTDKNAFKSEIQKTGSIFLLTDDTMGGLKDMSISGTRTSSFEKKTLNDYIISAKAGTYSTGGTKNPIIDFEVNSENFEFPTSEDPAADTSLKIQMLSDPDAFFESIRSMYKTIDDKKSSKIYYDRVILPIRDMVRTSGQNSVFAKSIEDLFTGTYINKQNQKLTRSLIKRDGTSFFTYQVFDEEVRQTWEFINSTSKYVYNSNAASEEFTDSDGTYKLELVGWDKNSIGYIEEVFNELVNKLYVDWYTKSKDLLEDDFINKVDNQIVFSGNIYNGPQSSGAMPSGTGFIDGSNMKLFVDSFAKSRVGATIFQASGTGYIFNVDNIEDVNALINNALFIVLAVALIILTLLFMTYILFAYRILGAFILMTVLAVMSATLAIATSWLGLTFGIETLIALFIIFAINCQLSITLIDSMKKSVYKMKRDFKSSLVLSIKENVGVIVDILVALLIPSFCLFWLSTAALKTFSILITFGVVFSLIGQLVVIFILFRLIIGTQIFNNIPFLFAANLSGNSNLEMIYLYKIDMINKKIYKAEKNNDSQKLELLKIKLSAQQEKLNKLYINQQEKISEQESKYIVHLKKQKGILENKLSKLKNDKRKLKLELKIIDIDKTLDQMGIEIEVNSNVVVETFDRYELSRFKSRSGFIAKILFVGLISISALSVGLGFGVGINYDSTMGGRVEYTIYGQNVRDGIKVVEEISKDAEASESLKSFAKDISSRVIENDDLNNAELYAEFISIGFSQYEKDIINFVSSEGQNSALKGFSLSGVTVETAFGDDFQYSTGESELKPWVLIKAKNINSRQSNKFKSVLYQLGVYENSENSLEYGMISKRIFSKTTTNTIVRTAIAFGASLLILGIYILIRYGWTYFVALAMGSVLLVGLIIVFVIGSHLLVGTTLVISLWALFLLFITFSLIYFGKIKEKLSSKDSKSMNEYFNTEIDVLMSLRNFRKNTRKDIQELKSKSRIELKERKLKFKTSKSKERKLNLNKDEAKSNIVLWTSEVKLANKETKLKFKIEINELKSTRKSEFKVLKKEGNEKVIVASKENNYILSVVLSVFKENLNKFIFILGIYAITFIIFMIFIPTIFSMGMTLLIGSILGWIIISFICLPVWLTIEQVRLRKNLTRKKFISELKVSNEEQIIEGIND
ncbi:bifunctional preprotein translocase subunit SecD/SecF [Spiroplasma sp. TIUS-1]|uniref:protein translocase SecDF, variant type n=1 Tax=Spiroplasma sp. TIUS-1 TaxID=216963 RepID=UPI00139814BF|nr:protein translocase SecDF, variant type [Spiroplasma sp. TIUS-1]QHX35952.1 bifunctional preprotein translocase subunit SecD/SecF [Spiroplasma sp. TIUS-1]